MDLETICNEYYRDVFRYSLSLTRDAHLADDIAQETFMKAISSISSFDGAKDIRAWLFTIARNTYVSRCRKEKRLVPQPLEEAHAQSTSVDFTSVLMDEQRALQIHRFLHAMEEPYKEVFSLRVFGELDFKTIGALFGKSDSWARVTFYRAKNQIKNYMEESEYESEL